MKNRINISNSRLSLVRYDRESISELSTNLSSNPKKFRFRSFGFVDETMLINDAKFYCNYIVAHPLEEHQIWMIENSSEKFGKLEYDTEEEFILTKAVSELIRSRKNLSVVEDMINAIDDKFIYDAYTNNKNIATTISDYLYNRENITPTSIDMPLNTFGKGYTVFNLLNDLVEDNSMICVDSDAVGDYNTMSIRKIDTRDTTTFITDKWYPILKVKGNKERVNLSLLYKGKVSVDIPENEFGEEPGPREFPAFRSLCIIKDGTLWTKKIAVKVNSEALQRKLVHLKAMCGNIVYTNEIILDLTKLPLIRKSSIKVSSFQYAKALIDKKFLDYKVFYYEKLMIKRDTGLPVTVEAVNSKQLSEREKFLCGLGIYGDYYVPEYKSKPTGKRHDFICLGIRTGLPTPDSMKQLIVDFINTGNCRNEILKSYLSSVDITSKPLENLKDEANNEKEELANVLRMYNFKLLIDRGRTFKEPGSPKINDKVLNMLVYEDKKSGKRYYKNITWRVLINHVFV